MPLPKLPTKPAALLLAKDYPTAEPGKAAARAVPSAKPKLAAVSEVPETIAKPAKTTRSKTAAPLEALAPAPTAAPAVKPAARGKEKQPVEAPHPVKHKPVEMMVKSKASRNADRSGSTSAVARVSVISRDKAQNLLLIFGEKKERCCGRI